MVDGDDAVEIEESATQPVIANKAPRRAIAAYTA